ncbi:hypothetical protein BS47DRAFT_1302017, partial [Hydnum rufescens UP504]
PAFPALDSIQRSGTTPTIVTPRTPSPDTLKMPPPSFLPRNAGSKGASLSIPSSSLTLPPSTSQRMPNTNTKGKARAKVALTPGHSPLDWARLKSSGEDLRGGITELQRITPSELKEHNAPDDAWACFNGKVYNITPYLPFHPGGQKELMRAAGRDGSKLFALTHSWVNLDYMLDNCLIGFITKDTTE